MSPGTCIHYDGREVIQPHGCCRAGVEYAKAFGAEGGLFLRLPCQQYRTKPVGNGMRGTYIKACEPEVREEIDRRGQKEIPCALLQLPTPEQVQESRRDCDAHWEKTMVALKVAGAWRIKPKPAQDRAEVIECPICKGKLHLSQSSYNGHVHGKCETEGCVSWME